MLLVSAASRCRRNGPAVVRGGDTRIPRPLPGGCGKALNSNLNDDTYTTGAAPGRPSTAAIAGMDRAPVAVAIR